MSPLRSVLRPISSAASLRTTGALGGIRLQVMEALSLLSES